MKYSGFYIYKHLDVKGKVLYVGLTTNMHQRQYMHQRTSKHKDLIYKTVFADAKNKTTMKFYELYYINLHHTKYNSTENRGDNLSWLKKLPKLKFYEYSIDNKKFGDGYPVYKTKYNIFEEIVSKYYDIRNYFKHHNEESFFNIEIYEGLNV